jgi:hypothetical protein
MFGGTNDYLFRKRLFPGWRCEKAGSYTESWCGHMGEARGGLRAKYALRLGEKRVVERSDREGALPSTALALSVLDDVECNDG